MGVFSESPKSFKIDRKSSLASKLKSSISRKLHQFLGNYTDDVLAEYITVLVCNGKHQNQARDDLEAFLGQRSAEFVTWLWDLLLMYAPRSNMTVGSSDPEDVTVTGTHDNRLRKLQNHGTENADGSPSKDEKFYHLSNAARNPILSNGMEIPEGVQRCPGFDAPLKEVNTTKASSQTSGREITKEVGANGNVRDHSLAYEPSRMGGLSKSSAQGAKREPVSRNMPFSVLGTIHENPHPRQSYAANVSGRSLSPKSVCAVSHRNDKLRGSVWDRLGKPCENTFVRGKNADAHVVDTIEQGEAVLDQCALLLPLPNSKLDRGTTVEVPRLDKRCTADSHVGEYRKSEHGMSAIYKHHVANNIGQKRHFGDIGAGPVTGSVFLVGEKNMDLQSKEDSQDFKRSTLTAQDLDATYPNLVSGCGPMVAKSESVKNDMTLNLKPFQAKVVDVKLRLLQIETEMSKLRSRQTEVEKDGRSNLLSNIGALKRPEEDIESRTVFVTNVHFAATKETLLAYFSKCGAVISVVTLTDKVTFRPKGSAYITFAAKDSVDKALELSGTSFFSRTIKVLRKSDVAAETSVPAQHAAKPSQPRFPHIRRKVVLDRPHYMNSHLQWRREFVSIPSEPSASRSTEEKRVVASACMQQLPISLTQVKNREGASSSMETRAAA